MQQTGMPANFNDLRLNADVRLEPHPLVKKQTPNFTVENVVAPRRVYDGKKTRVLATVAGFGTQKATKNVSLVLNGRVVETKPVEMPENGRATVEFLSLEVPYGRNKGEVRVDSGDPLPADDVFYFSVERADPRHALFVHETGNDRGLALLQGRAGGFRAGCLRHRSGHHRADHQRLSLQVRLRGAVRCRLDPRRLRK